MQGTTRGIELSRLLTDGVTGVELTTSGIDLTFDYMTGLLGGELNIEAQGSFVMDNAFEDFIFRNLQLQPSYQANGFTNYFRNPLTISPFRGIGWVTSGIRGCMLPGLMMIGASGLLRGSRKTSDRPISGGKSAASYSTTFTSNLICHLRQ